MLCRGMRQEGARGQGAGEGVWSTMKVRWVGLDEASTPC